MSTSKYYLQNEAGSRVGLTPGTDLFWLKNVEGLGIDSENQFADIDEGFFTMSDDGWPQTPIVGDLVFMQDAYENYRQFANWMMNAQRLLFIYVPIGADEYIREVKLSRLTKPPRKTGTLICDIAFDPLTPWYLPRSVDFSATETPENVMRYPWRYGQAVYGTLGGSMAVIVPPAGHMPAAWELTYDGELINPQIIITGQGSGAVYGRVKIDTTIVAGDRLSISTRYLDSYIRADVGGDLLPHVDLQYDPYPRLPLSEPVKVAMSATNDLEGTLRMSVYNYYRTV